MGRIVMQNKVLMSCRITIYLHFNKQIINGKYSMCGTNISVTQLVFYFILLILRGNENTVVTYLVSSRA